MDDPLNPRLPGRVEKYPRVGHCSRMVNLAPRETRPIGVIKRPCSPQRFSQPPWITEIQPPDLDRRSLRGAPRMAGQRAHPAADGLKFPGDRGSRVAERPGDNVEPSRAGLVRHGITPVSYAGHWPGATSLTLHDCVIPFAVAGRLRLHPQAWEPLIVNGAVSEPC
jgi:hypothetical protein